MKDQNSSGLNSLWGGHCSGLERDRSWKPSPILSPATPSHNTLLNVAICQPANSRMAQDALTQPGWEGASGTISLPRGPGIEKDQDRAMTPQVQLVGLWPLPAAHTECFLPSPYILVGGEGTAPSASCRKSSAAPQDL